MKAFLKNILIAFIIVAIITIGCVLDEKRLGTEEALLHQHKQELSKVISIADSFKMEHTDTFTGALYELMYGHYSGMDIIISEAEPDSFKSHTLYCWFSKRTYELIDYFNYFRREYPDEFDFSAYDLPDIITPEYFMEEFEYLSGMFYEILHNPNHMKTKFITT